MGCFWLHLARARRTYPTPWRTPRVPAAAACAYAAARSRSIPPSRSCGPDVHGLRDVRRCLRPTKPSRFDPKRNKAVVNATTCKDVAHAWPLPGHGHPSCSSSPSADLLRADWAARGVHDDERPLGAPHRRLSVQLVQLRRRRFCGHPRDSRYRPICGCCACPCSGRINPLVIFKALEEGRRRRDGSGCHPGDCHYISGNRYGPNASWRCFAACSNGSASSPSASISPGCRPSEGARYAVEVAEFVDKVRALGRRNPMARLGVAS